MPKINSNWKNMPINFVIAVTIATLIISFFGPIKYSGYEKGITLLFVLCYLAAILIARKLAIISRISINELGTNIRMKNKINDIYIFFLYFEILIKLLLLISSYQKYGLPSSTNFFNAFAETYSQKSTGQFEDDNIFRQIDTLFTLGYFGIISYSLLNWKTISHLSKLLFSLVILLNLTYTTLYLGDQKPFLDVIIFIISAYLMTQTNQNKNLIFSKKGLLLVLGCLIALFFFSTVISTRLSNFGYSESNYISPLISIDTNNFMLALLPENIRHQVGYALLYPTMGWYGLSLSLQLPFNWSYGFGSFRGLNSFLTQFFNVENMYEYTYLAALESRFGYDGLSNWNTIFPWLASDLTFIGSIIYMAIMSYIYTISWINTVKNKNPISFLMFCNLNIMFIYSIANNQIFHQRSSAIASLSLFAIWFTYNKSFNKNT